jgi:hypothetical protein
MHQTTTTGQTNLNLSAMPDGTYFIKVMTPSENRTVKIVKIQ